MILGLKLLAGLNGRSARFCHTNRGATGVRPIRAGDTVEVRPFAQIAATLDERGELDGLPFMPEMVAYCGKRFEVWKRADKTCDEASGGTIRRPRDTVHLKELRCDGAAHDGCDAGCLLFWKERWLQKVDSGPVLGRNTAAASSNGAAENGSAHSALETVNKATRYRGRPGDDSNELFACQATEISRFSEPLPWWDLHGT
jgi:hypothetical protein